MFYSNEISNSYRMGDIIENFYEVIPEYDKNNDLSIKLLKPKMFVILTPCCSIEGKEAIIVPLKKIKDKLIVSEFLRENLSLINIPITKKEALGEQAYSDYIKKLSPEDKILFDNTPLKEYAFHDLFIFDKHNILEEYHLEKKRGKSDIVSIDTKCYMISFKDVMKVQSSIFERNQTSYSKVLELTPKTRQILRNKLTFFYSRVPDEDKPYI